MHYTGSNTPVTRGNDAGSRAEIVLGPGEFITAVQGFFSGTALAELKFTNNKGIVHRYSLFNGISHSPGSILGLHFGPYGAEKEKNVTDRFDWRASDKAPVELAERMGLYCFSGRSYAIFLDSHLSDMADPHPAMNISTSFVQRSP